MVLTVANVYQAEGPVTTFGTSKQGRLSPRLSQKGGLSSSQGQIRSIETSSSFVEKSEKTASTVQEIATMGLPAEGMLLDGALACTRFAFMGYASLQAVTKRLRGTPSFRRSRALRWSDFGCQQTHSGRLLSTTEDGV